MKFEDTILGVLMIVLAVFTTVLFAAVQYPTSSDSEGYVCTEFKWFDDSYREVYLSIPVADIEGYKSSMIPRMYCPVAADRFITEDSTVKEIADRFDDMTMGKDDRYRVKFVNSFIYSCITYKDDSEVHGYTEYYQYPVETLLLRSGDCEDMAILEIAILRAMGYDTILLMNNEHAMTGVNVDADGRYTEVFGKRYYHLDPTMGDGIGISDDDAIPWLSIYKDIAFVICAVAAIICLMGVSEMIWNGKDEEISDICINEVSDRIGIAK